MSEPTSELLSRAAYARHRGVAPNAVLKAVRTGRIARAVVFGLGGKIRGIKWRLADQLWKQNTDIAQAVRAAGLRGPAHATAAPQPPGADVWTRDAAIGRAAALARVDALEHCQRIGFLDGEPLSPSELLDLVDVLLESLADRLQPAIGAGPAGILRRQLLEGKRDARGLTLDEALELARRMVR